MRVAVVDIDATAEARLLRLHLEWLGLDVRLTGTGRPSDIADALTIFGNPSRLALICAHGDADGFIMPDLAPGSDDWHLTDNRLRPDDIREHIRLDGTTVISTACATGTDDFAAAFHETGADVYLAPDGEPDGRTAALIVALVIQLVVSDNLRWSEALARAASVLPDAGLFRVWPAGG